MMILDPASAAQLITTRLRCCAYGARCRRIGTTVGPRRNIPLWLTGRGYALLLCHVLAWGSVVGAAGGGGAATRPVAAHCEDAAQAAAARTGVPVDVLRALALTETGRLLSGTLRPWPWALNVQGAGYWLDDRATALGMARREIGRGVRNIDLGCFQINYRWHGDHFDSLAQMLDPAANALYAATFIASLYRETGTWEAAAGAYHSRTPVHARRYRQRFRRIFASLDSDGGAGLSGVPAPLDGGGPGDSASARLAAAGPFIGAAGAGQLGSLFSAPDATGRPLVPIGGAAREVPQ